MSTNHVHQQTTTTRDFFTYGTVGLDLNRAAERRAAEAHDARIAAAVPPAQALTSRLLANLGVAMIRAGHAIAGTTPAARQAPESATPTLGMG